VRKDQKQEIVLRPATSRSEWEEGCGAFPDATAFHDYDFLNCIAPSLRCKFEPLLVISQKQLVGVAPLLVKQLGPFCTINWVPFPYLGPLVPADLIPATLSVLRREARRRRALNHQQSFSQKVTNYEAEEFTVSTDRTFVIPLSGRSDEDLLEGMHHTRRRDIRRARRNGLEIGSADPDDFRLMDTWVDQVYTAQGMTAEYPVGTYERLYRSGHNASGWTFSTARLNGRAIAVLIILSTARRAFAWQIGVDPSYRSKYPQDLLIWHALLRARDTGAIEFDLVGAPNDGIALYKIRFGTLERQYTVLQRQTRSHHIAVTAIPRLVRSTSLWGS